MMVLLLLPNSCQQSTAGHFPVCKIDHRQSSFHCSASVYGKNARIQMQFMHHETDTTSSLQQ